MSLIDQDRPSTWIPYRESLCRSCEATCCMMPVEVRKADLVRLGLSEEGESPKKTGKRLMREGVVKTYRAATGLFQLEQRRGRDCYFLESDRRCRVYEHRPDVCRSFPVTCGPRPGFCPYKKKK